MERNLRKKVLAGLAAALGVGALLTRLSAQESPSPTPDQTAQSQPAGAAATNQPAEIGMPEFVGAETCLACHAGKEGFKESLHAKVLLNNKRIEFSKTCETCHGPGSLHAAAAGDRANPGYFTIKNPRKVKAVEANATCLQCHGGGKRVHWIGGVHESKNVTCQSCHSIHEAKSEAFQLVKETQAETCYQCHADKKAQIRKSAHMPLVEGKMGCTSCHEPHGSGGEKLMVKASVNDTCYTCHADKRGPFLWEHDPVRESCLNCHNPHGTHNDKMLVTKAPLLCQRCHVATRHPSTLYDQTYANKGANKLVNKACANCHSLIHGSNHPSGNFFAR